MRPNRPGGTVVGAVRVPPTYPSTPPYHPSERYPEYPFADAIGSRPNYAYHGVRELLRTLNLDGDRFGSRAWNPLGALISPGMTVVLKPNFVLSRHKAGKDLFSIITHPSVLRAVADYCWIALAGSGAIIIADAPQYDCDFQELLAATQLETVATFLTERGRVSVEIRDLRQYWSRGRHFDSMLEALPGDPCGAVVVDLADRSALYGRANSDKLYGAVYRRKETIAHHSGERHEYELSKTVLGADVVISVPKLKVHKKVGVTLNAKGLVGIATNKNYLVHYTLTPPSDGGDQYPDRLLNPMEKWLLKLERWMYDHLLASRKRPLEYLHRSVYAVHNATTKRLGLKVDERKRAFDAGNWHGNDSAWRMTADLVQAFLFADVTGALRSTQQRRTFSIVDGIVGGDGNGPLTPDPVAAGTLVGGEDLIAVDVVATRLMGFDPARIRLYRYLLDRCAETLGFDNLDDIEVRTDVDGWSRCLQNTTDPFLGLRPHPGWIGHIECHTADATALKPIADLS